MINVRAFILWSLAILLFPAISIAQGLENILVERYYQTDAADAANAVNNGSVSPLVVGSTVYRVYVDMAPNYKFSNVFGNANHDLVVNTSTYFYNDPNYGVSVHPGAISQVNIKKHTAMIDSWFTTGGVCAGKVGVTEADDADGTLGNNQGILANNPGGCFGLPLIGATGRDGLAPFDATTFVVPNVLGLGNALDALEQTEGNNITISNGTIAALGGVVGPTAANRVLIGQFTTHGDFSFQLNVQLVNILTGIAENYVSSNPIGNELTHPTLTYVPNTPPVVAITFPTNNATLTIGDTYNLTVNASDNVTVSSVDFYVDNVLIGSDATAPFSVSYVATSGTHQVYAIANDNECATATASIVNFNVTNNLAPVVTLTAPTSAIVDESIVLSATATDSDGTVTQVAFYINGELVGTDATAPYSINYIATDGMNQIITAIATDNVGAIGTSNEVVLNVNSNVAPVVSVSGPASIIEGEEVTITATASDSDGTVVSVEFYWNDQLIGVDNIAPYTVDYTPTAGTAQTIFAVAIDNIGAETISSEITIDVNPNVAPTASILSPNETDLFIAPATVTVVADASDIDGTVSVVDFYVNGALFNTLYAAPYTIDWTSVPGDVNITVIATDNLGLASAPFSIEFTVADPNALPYKVNTATQTCDEPTFCAAISINPAFPVDNVIGYDITMTYDASKVLPTGNVTVFDVLTNPAFVETSATIVAPGELQITAFFNGESLEFTEFTGYGDILCVEFERLPNFNAIDSTEISVPFLQESYIMGVEEKGVEAGNLYSSFPTAYLSHIVFWQDQSPLAYDIDNPNDFVPTYITGFENGTVVNELSPVVTNTEGSFVHNLENGTEIGFSRDIANNQSVQLLVNAADAVLAKTLVSSGNFTPTIHQVLALDVNLDGVVSAGDITQLKQRATLAIGEFQQAWNYDNEGNSNGQPSKDWIFVDATTVNQDAAYAISSTFPEDDGIGFSKARVPSVPFVLPTAISGYTEGATACPMIMEETYHAVLLGDVNGSFANYDADGVLRSSKDFILVDLANAVQESDVLHIPLSISHTEAIQGIDLALQWNTTAYPWMNTVNVQNLESSKFMNEADQTFRYSAFNAAGIEATTFATLSIRTNEHTLSEVDFENTLGLINGKKAKVIFNQQAPSASQWSIWPNPSNGNVQVFSEMDGIITVTSLTGDLVYSGSAIQSLETTDLQLSHLNAGIYFVQLKNDSYTATKKIIITK